MTHFEIKRSPKKPGLQPGHTLHCHQYPEHSQTNTTRRLIWAVHVSGNIMTKPYRVLASWKTHGEVLVEVTIGTHGNWWYLVNILVNLQLYLHVKKKFSWRLATRSATGSAARGFDPQDALGTATTWRVLLWQAPSQTLCDQGHSDNFVKIVRINVWFVLATKFNEILSLVVE